MFFQIFLSSLFFFTYMNDSGLLFSFSLSTFRKKIVLLQHRSNLYFVYCYSLTVFCWNFIDQYKVIQKCEVYMATTSFQNVKELFIYYEKLPHQDLSWTSTVSIFLFIFIFFLYLYLFCISNLWWSIKCHGKYTNWFITFYFTYLFCHIKLPYKIISVPCDFWYVGCNQLNRLDT